jgi:hypothetical protein
MPVLMNIYSHLSSLHSLPATREGLGGNMLLWHLQDEHVACSIKRLKDSSAACIVYAANFCDVKQMVSPIISGHYFRLKYNLYLCDSSSFPSSITGTTCNELVLWEKLSELLSNPSFLPMGGKLGYSLMNHYPVFVYQNDDSETSGRISKCNYP